MAKVVDSEACLHPEVQFMWRSKGTDSKDDELCNHHLRYWSAQTATQTLLCPSWAFSTV